MSLRVNFNSYNYDFKPKIWDISNADSQEPSTGSNISQRETYVTWRYDEDGNIVYYTFDKNSGELIDTHKYKNPAKI